MCDPFLLLALFLEAAEAGRDLASTLAAVAVMAAKSLLRPRTESLPEEQVGAAGVSSGRE
jgi:hypothetical protein